MALLALIAGQDVEWIDDPNAPGSRWWQIARQVAHDRVISTVDPDTRHAHKTRERRHDGFKAHVVAEPDTGIITAVSLTKATGPGTGDAAAGAALLATDDTSVSPSRPGSRSSGLPAPVAFSWICAPNSAELCGLPAS